MLENVNSTDLLDAIRLGCRTMGQVFNRDDNDIPFMSSCVWPKARFSYSAYHAECHIPGRHLNALLTAEALCGVEMDEEVIRKHAEAAYFSFSGAIPLPLNRMAKDGKPVGHLVHFVDHNIREGMHALYALSRFRKDERADRLMRQVIEFIQEHFLSGFSWDDTVTKNPQVSMAENPFFIAGAARAIGPLVKYYRSSGYEPALHLAQQLANEARKHYPENGAFDQKRMGTNHAHSVTCTLSSLAQLGDATGDMALLSHVKAFYDNGLQQLCNELGWAPELTDATEVWRGEVNTSGDIVECALILGRHFGKKYFEDAERMVRAHILPSQLRDISFIAEPENPDGDDRLRDVAQRHLGAFGFPAPYGHQICPGNGEISFNMDIVGGGVASLCEVYGACTRLENGIHHVDMFFDSRTEAMQVISPYEDEVLRIVPYVAGPIFIRLPSWADGTVYQGNPRWEVLEDRLYIPRAEAGREIAIPFPLTEREVTLHHSTLTLKARLKGDRVLCMENPGTEFTFFPEYRGE